MARKTKEEAERTRQRTLDAAVDVFFERGVAHPSLTEIADAIGMTRGAVYGHFCNKSEVLVALFDRERLPWESMVDDADAAVQRDPLGVARADLVRLLTMACDSPRRVRTLNVLFYKVELAVESASLVQRLEAARARSLEHVAGLLRRAVHAGQLPACRDVERDARFLLFSVFGALLDWLWDPSRFDLAAQAEELVDAWMLPLRTAHARPGHPARPADVARLGRSKEDQQG